MQQKLASTLQRGKWSEWCEWIIGYIITGNA